MEIKIKYILNFEFVFTFFMIIGGIIFLQHLINKIKTVIKTYKSFIIYIFVALIPILIYQITKSFIQETSHYTRFDSEYLSAICSYLFASDIVIWVIYKFIQAYSKKNMYKLTDIDNPEKIKNNIESMIKEQNFMENKEILKLYNTLQLNSLSIKKQQKIIRTNFVKNFLISILFFVLGLLIPELIKLIMH